jgi:hypothetical protein
MYVAFARGKEAAFRGARRSFGHVVLGVGARRRSQDAAVRLPGRIEDGRSVPDQRELQRERQHGGLRGAGSARAGYEAPALPRDELGNPGSAALALSLAQGREVSRMAGFYRGRRHFLGASGSQRSLGPQGPASGGRPDREGRRLHRRFRAQDAESVADQRVGNLGHVFQELVGGVRR